MVSPELQQYLVSKFTSWQPTAPAVLLRRPRDLTLDWGQRHFAFLAHNLIYKLEKNNKLPKWIVVYSGGKTTKRIDNLPPRHPHKFRVKVILKAEAVPQLAQLALQHYGDENTVYEVMEQLNEKSDESNGSLGKDYQNGDNIGDCNSIDVRTEKLTKMDIKNVIQAVKLVNEMKKNLDGGGDRTNGSGTVAWLESLVSPETWTNTESDGTSPVCFSMAVRCGYLKQVQAMVEERPELLGLVNCTTGHTPLATAVKKGDINTVRFLLSLGADVNQPSLAGQAPLHLAVRAGDLALTHLLLDKGADATARDCNGLRAEHYAVDSCDLDTLRYILDRGDPTVRDNNGWTPLFRALCQGAKASIVEELMQRGSDVDIVDRAGLPLMAVAKLLKDRHGQARDSVLRLVNKQYPREKALAHFTRITKKIHYVHTLLNIN